MTLKLSDGDGSSLKWTKSSYSSNDGPACVEVASTPSTIHIRDSKNPLGPQLHVQPSAWADFLSYAASAR
ncbi:DUF397 domain-containing protein [Streptomyces inhibens]|uniref:DUF397 domain-containing protein n=1 Tax=Streptomyces inhibens TaxID=2293571 RepID=UPI001EE7645C|nr:DUF397 domain-containing protein [Streptomyces inhibens]UKY51569.1 DUF397 domain-containing protein [Streptomyces inhibens]